MYEIFMRLLAERGVTAAEVCKATGVSPSTISNWKKRNNVLSPVLLGKLADYFDVSLDYMMGKDEKSENTDNVFGAGQVRSISRLTGNGGTGKSRVLDVIKKIMMEEHDGFITLARDYPEIPQEAVDRWEKYKEKPLEVQQAIDLLLGYVKPSPGQQDSSDQTEK